jgi:8-oxo-dGTP pyrophosphatase MutT (NUDIX family)
MKALVMAEDVLAPRQQNVVPAATVVVFRHSDQGPPEILMVQRSKSLSFAGAAVVFPGGKVHASDVRLASQFPSHPAVDAAARIAGIREALEETGLVLGTTQRPTADEAIAARAMLAADEDLAPVLKHFGWELDIDRLVPFAHWLPNFKTGRVFDTRFYLANLGSGRVDLTPDLGESTRLFWITAVNALAMIETGELKAIFPTRRNLERLAQFASFAEAERHARETPITTVSPRIERHNGVDMLRIPDAIGYPITMAPLTQASVDG